MARLPRLLALLVAAPLLAGCVEDDPAGAHLGDAGDTLTGTERVWNALAAIPAPTFSADDAVTHWETFVTTYPKRDWLLPHNEMAADHLGSQLASYGYETEEMRFEGSLQGLLDVPADVRVIRGVLEGNDTGHRFALVAHYDGQLKTTQAAYDDGAGTIAQLEICKLLSQRKGQLNHTIECLFFDAEEQGLVASEKYVEWYQNDVAEFRYDLVFGYDMTGINWPGHEWKLYAMIGTDTDELGDLTAGFGDFLKVALHDYLGNATLPGAPEGIEILAKHDRNSDEQSFKKAGIPVVRFAGGRRAADYPAYHQPHDTVPYVYQFVGGRDNFEKGYNAVILSSYYTILGFDAFNPWTLPTA